MTKSEFIARYGQEAYDKILEYNRNWRKANKAHHAELNNNWKKKHPDYYNDYDKEHRRIYHKNINRSRPYMNKYKATHKHCEICGAPTDDVHHIVPIPNDRVLDFGDPILLEGNLMAVCENCHTKLHNEMRK